MKRRRFDRARVMAAAMALAVLPTVALAEPPAKQAESNAEKEKRLSGMSIVGNDEAPKSLVIVPWKSSDLGDGLEVSRALGGGREPIDRDVFLRELTYYEIRVGR